MKRNLLLAALLTGMCVVLSVCLIATTGCNTLANLHVINPSYSLRSVDPHLNLSIPPSIDLNFTVNVNNPNPVGLTLNAFDFDVLVNNNAILRNVHSSQGFQIPAQGASDVHLATHVSYDSIRSIYNEVLNMIQGNKATYGIQGNATYDTPVGPMTFPVTVSSR